MVHREQLEMWGRRGKRGTKLSRQLALGLLEDAMGQVQDPNRESEPENPVVPAPRRGGLIPAYLTKLGKRRSA